MDFALNFLKSNAGIDSPALLSSPFISKARLKGSYTAREADDIANLAFIGGKTNRAISDKAPLNYFPAIREKGGDTVFTAQCIPLNESLLVEEGYKAFLRERRKLIAGRLNEFLGTTMA